MEAGRSGSIRPRTPVGEMDLTSSVSYRPSFLVLVDIIRTKPPLFLSLKPLRPTRCILPRRMSPLLVRNLRTAADSRPQRRLPADQELGVGNRGPHIGGGPRRDGPQADLSSRVQSRGCLGADRCAVHFVRAWRGRQSIWMDPSPSATS